MVEFCSCKIIINSGRLSLLTNNDVYKNLLCIDVAEIVWIKNIYSIVSFSRSLKRAAPIWHSKTTESTQMFRYICRCKFLSNETLCFRFFLGKYSRVSRKNRNTGWKGRGGGKRRNAMRERMQNIDKVRRENKPYAEGGLALWERGKAPSHALLSGCAPSTYTGNQRYMPGTQFRGQKGIIIVFQVKSRGCINQHSGHRRHTRAAHQSAESPSRQNVTCPISDKCHQYRPYIYFC